jgi:PKD repeat protein
LAVPNYVYNIEGTYQISLTVTGSNGCSYGYPINANVIVYSPKAHFSPDVTSGCPPLSVNFSDHSTGATSWQWSFGDGSTSTAQHPSHVYNSIGNYTVTLIVTNGTGCSDTLVYPTHIVAAAPTVNYVTPAPIYGCVPFSANFADASTSSAWLWDFGDGTVSNLANPNHTYTSEGTFVVSLTTWGLNGGCERTISNFQTIIIDQAHPGFTYTVSPCPPYLVTFTDTSLNTVGWNWSFGDGGNSTLQNPTHVYNNTGSYNITLTGTSPTGCNTDVSISGGVVISGLGAHPSIQVLDTVAPFDVIFHANTQLATWWSWDFGDGSSSSLQNPSHTYLTSGPFTISLTIGNDSCQFTFNYPPVTMGSTGGGSVVIGTDSLPPPPIQYHCAPYEVSFVAPFPSVSSIEWNFGDGTTSTSLNPVHVFADSGVFVVSAIVNHSGVIDTVFMNEWYYIVEPVTDFQITTVNTCTGVITTAATASSASSYLWNFGNGITFNSASANYTYPNIDASYMVSLNISDTNQCSSFISKSFTINTLSPITANVRRTCANDSVLFNAGNINYNSYLWDFGDGNTSSIKNPAHAYADSGSYNVMLIVTDILGCSDTFNLAYQIIVYNPIASFNYTTTTNCTTVVVILNNTSINYSGYHWMFSDNSSSNSINPVKTFSTPGYYSLGLAVSNNICVDTMWMNNAIYVSRPVADFTFSQSSVCLPVTVNYIDLSIDANTWEWDFGDGTTSVLQNPSHVFTSVPHNPVTLKIKDVNGCQKVITKPNIEITYADFIATSSGNCNPVTVTFADSSHNAISWHWDFGDGTTSTNPNEVHTYTSNGIYNVELVVESAEGCFDTLRIDSLVNVGQSHADFSADSVSGCVPLMAQFTDLSTNVVAWDWDFGDGGTSTNQNPNHIFTTPGNYSIRLITTNSYGCKDTIVKSQFINVKGSVPMFSLSTVSGCAPLFVDFNDLSQGAIAWEWQFGDGTSDTSQSADHIYQNSGNYVASLFTTDSTGCLSIFTYPVAVTVSGVPIASFSVTNTLGCTPFNIEIVDSGSVADSLIWNMGDGNVIYGSNPVYTYNQPGVYHLQLIAKNNGGCTDTINYPDPIVVKLTPVASYVSDIQNGCSPVPVSFSNTSTDLDSPTYYWDFGNGDTSTESNPIYNYLDEGVYSPTLIVTNTGGCADTIVYVDYLDIYDQLPPSATQLYRVSVVDNNHVKVNWRLNLQNDMDYYVVYRYNASTSQFDSIATVPQNVVAVSGAAPEYIDSGLNTLQYSYTYKVKAVDLCGHSLPLSALKAHSTMELSSNAGNMQVSLAWSPYMGCEISAYEIYRTELNSSVNQLIATVDTLTLGYLDTTAYCPQDFGYSIRARDICGDANFDSWSDTTHALPFSNLDSQQLFITRSTVVDDKFVLTEWGEVNYRPDLVERFNIYRSTDKINYELIASVPSIVHDYSDWDVNVDYNAYYYKVEIQNVCNTNTLEGNISSSILLNAIQTEVSNHLKWSKYVDWNTGVERYVIEKLNLAGQWEVIETVPGSTTEWEEE